MRSYSKIALGLDGAGTGAAVLAAFPDLSRDEPAMADEIPEPDLRPQPMPKPEILGALFWRKDSATCWHVRWIARGKAYRDTVSSLPMLGLGIARLVIGSHVPNVLVCEQPFSTAGGAAVSMKVSRAAGMVEAGIVLGVDSWRMRPPAAVYATAVEWRPGCGIPSTAPRVVAKDMALRIAPIVMPTLEPILGELGYYDDLAEAALLAYLGLTVWKPGQTQDDWLKTLQGTHETRLKERARASKERQRARARRARKTKMEKQ